MVCGNGHGRCIYRQALGLLRAAAGATRPADDEAELSARLLEAGERLERAAEEAAAADFDWSKYEQHEKKDTEVEAAAAAAAAEAEADAEAGGLAAQLGQLDVARAQQKRGQWLAAAEVRGASIARSRRKLRLRASIACVELTFVWVWMVSVRR
jgi:hypothetical protein